MKQVIEGLEEGLNAIAEALEGSGPDIPTPAAADEGKVLTAGDDGTASWEDVPDELPTISGDSDAGKVVTAHYSTLSGEGSYQLDNIRQVPDTTGVTNGYVLTNNNGTPAWAAASGGGGGGSTISSMTGIIYADEKGGTFYAEFSDQSLNINTNVLAIYVKQADSADWVVKSGVDVSFVPAVGGLFVYFSNALGYDYDEVRVIYAN